MVNVVSHRHEQETPDSHSFVTNAVWRWQLTTSSLTPQTSCCAHCSDVAKVCTSHCRVSPMPAVPNSVAAYYTADCHGSDGTVVLLFVCAGHLHLYSWNNVSREYSVATTVQLLFTVRVMLFPVLNLLYFYIAVSSMTVFCSSWLHALPICCSGIFWMNLR